MISVFMEVDIFCSLFVQLLLMSVKMLLIAYSVDMTVLLDMTY